MGDGLFVSVLLCTITAIRAPTTNSISALQHACSRRLVSNSARVCPKALADDGGCAAGLTSGGQKPERADMLKCAGRERLEPFPTRHQNSIVSRSSAALTGPSE